MFWIAARDGRVIIIGSTVNVFVGGSRPGALRSDRNHESRDVCDAVRFVFETEADPPQTQPGVRLFIAGWASKVRVYTRFTTVRAAAAAAHATRPISQRSRVRRADFVAPPPPPRRTLLRQGEKNRGRWETGSRVCRSVSALFHVVAVTVVRPSRVRRSTRHAAANRTWPWSGIRCIPAGNDVRFYVIFASCSDGGFVFKSVFFFLLFTPT